MPGYTRIRGVKMGELKPSVLGAWGSNELRRRGRSMLYGIVWWIVLPVAVFGVWTLGVYVGLVIAR